MSRSIHTIQRDLLTERRFAFANGDACQEITVVEREDIQKRIYKINETRKRAANRSQAVAYAKLRIGETGPERKIQKTKGKLSDNS